VFAIEKAIKHQPHVIAPGHATSPICSSAASSSSVQPSACDLSLNCTRLPPDHTVHCLAEEVRMMRSIIVGPIDWVALISAVLAIAALVWNGVQETRDRGRLRLKLEPQTNAKGTVNVVWLIMINVGKRRLTVTRFGYLLKGHRLPRPFEQRASEWRTVEPGTCVRAQLSPPSIHSSYEVNCFWALDHTGRICRLRGRRLRRTLGRFAWPKPNESSHPST
jgi:hypothetical protein